MCVYIYIYGNEFCCDGMSSAAVEGATSLPIRFLRHISCTARVSICIDAYICVCIRIYRNEFCCDGMSSAAIV